MVLPAISRREIAIKYRTDDPWGIIEKILQELAEHQLLYGNLVMSLQRSGVESAPLDGAPIPDVKDAISQSKWLGFDKDKPPAHTENT